MFPHHDNEMAQSEAYHQCGQWVNYFFHAGHLHIKGLKMSKSLKNFVTIRQALQEHSARQLRLMFLMQPWDKPMNYSDQTVDDAKAKEKYFKNFFGSVKSLLRNKSEPFQARHSSSSSSSSSDKDLSKSLNVIREKVHNSFCDNFKAYEVVQHLVDLVSECNKYLTTEQNPKHLLFKKVSTYLTKILRILGVVKGHDVIGFGETINETGATKEEKISPYVDAIVKFRQQIRLASKSKQIDSNDLLKFCDDAKLDTFANLGIQIEDDTSANANDNANANANDNDNAKQTAPVWKFEDPQVIRNDIEEKLQKEFEKLGNLEEEKLEFPN